MKWFVLLVGVALTAFGIALYVVQYVNEWNCAHSPIPTSCPTTTLARLFIVYPSIAVGLVLIVYSLLSYQHQRRNREDSQHR
jgi:hypothetical protein